MPDEDHDAGHEPLGEALEILDGPSLELPVEVALGARQQQVIGGQHMVRIPFRHPRRGARFPSFSGTGSLRGRAS